MSDVLMEAGAIPLGKASQDPEGVLQTDFNAIQQVPYRLPDNKTVSGWKTNSTPDGGRNVGSTARNT